MDCHLFIDEVGNSDLKCSDERYLSLSGIITKAKAHKEIITPQIEKLKVDLFEHNPPSKIVVLHRKEILKRLPPFDVLKDPEINSLWEQRILGLIESLPYILMTVVIDKQEHTQKYGVWKYNPYHYCLHNLVERYVLWMRRHQFTGNVIIEPRYKKADKALKKSFKYIYENGTDSISASVFQNHLTSREIKFKQKKLNVSGLQLADLLAYPSQMAMRKIREGKPIAENFGGRIFSILTDKKYARNPVGKEISGWGQKWLP